MVQQTEITKSRYKNHLFFHLVANPKKKKIKTLITSFDEESNFRTFSHKRMLKCFVQVKYNSKRRKIQ